jgi:hypothetical protein
MAEEVEVQHLDAEKHRAAVAFASGIASAILGRGTPDGIALSINSIRQVMENPESNDLDWQGRYFEAACHMIATFTVEEGQEVPRESVSSVIGNLYGLAIHSITGNGVEVVVNEKSAE